jgi:hypothetical protein
VNGENSKAREMRAAYMFNFLFKGVRAELERSLPLDRGERLISEGAVRTYRNPLLQRPTYLRLTNKRLCVLTGYVFRGDTITEVPRLAMRSMARVGRRLELVWTASDGTSTTVSLGPNTGMGFVGVGNYERDLNRLETSVREWRAATD